MSWLELESSTVFVVGAGGGIGQAVARAFADQGARLAIFDRDESALGTLAEALPGTNLAVPLDLACPENVRPAFESAAAQLGAPDALVNVAATTVQSSLADLAHEALADQFQINTAAALQCAQAFRNLRDPDRLASIVNISSIAAEHAVPHAAGYSLSKAALTMLTRQLAVEWGPEGIRCNVVSPGLILTPLTQAFYANPRDRQAREAVVPARRIGKPEDVADAAVFLSSARAGYISGADIVVDGAFTRTLMTHIPRRYD